MIAGPERDASLRCDQHEPPVSRGSSARSTAPRRETSRRRTPTPPSAERRRSNQSNASGRKKSIAGRTRIAAPDKNAGKERTSACATPRVSCPQIDGSLQRQRRRDRDGRVQRFGKHVGRDPDERWVDRREPGRDDARTRSCRAHCRECDQPDRDRADDRLSNLDAGPAQRWRSSCRRRSARESRVSRRAAELRRGAGRRFGIA